MIEPSAVRSDAPYNLNPDQPAAEAQTELIRIAIADDHPAFREGLHEILQLEQDFRVVGMAADGAAILEMVEKYQPEILLLDLFMPGMNGLDILRRLRERGSATKVIVLTASEDREHLVEAMQSGAAGVVLKHDETSILIKSIHRVHAGEIWLHSSTTQAVMQRSEPTTLEPAAKLFARDPVRLTRKELEVVRMVAQGLRNREIASRMLISEQTVKNHLRAIFEKVRVGDRLELALFAIHHILGTD
jgi:DNA-binding NarL/FixJ family response regulator